MELRDATISDIPAIHAIYHHYVLTSVATLQEELPTLEDLQSKLTHLYSINMPFFVASDGPTKRIVGYAYADSLSDRTGYSRTTEDSVYIHPDFTGRGIAGKLLDKVFVRLKEDERKVVISKMSIEAGKGIETLPSARLHLSMGFEEVGRMRKVGEKLGIVVDVLILQLDLERYENDGL